LNPAGALLFGSEAVERRDPAARLPLTKRSHHASRERSGNSKDAAINATAMQPPQTKEASPVASFKP